MTNVPKLACFDDCGNTATRLLSRGHVAILSVIALALSACGSNSAAGDVIAASQSGGAFGAKGSSGGPAYGGGSKISGGSPGDSGGASSIASMSSTNIVGEGAAPSRGGSSGIGGTGAEPFESRGGASSIVRSGPALLATAEDLKAARIAVEAFLSSRNEASPVAAKTLEATLLAKGITAKDVEELLRLGPLTYPDLLSFTPSPLGQVILRDVECFHVDYSSTYYQYLPVTYNAGKPHPLVVVGHGGNSAMSREYAESTALMYVSAYSDLADGELGAILVAPATTVGWNPIGDALVEATISQVVRDFNVDPERIYITGQSMGGHLSWRSAINHGDRFAAFSPQSGGYANYIDNHQIENLFGTFGYVTYGTTEPYSLDVTNDLLGAWLMERHYPWTVVKKDGGHEIYADEIPKVGHLFAQHARDLYPPKTYYHAVGDLRYPVATTPPEVIRAGRAMRWNFRNWIEIDARPELAEGETFYGENRGNNRIEIVTNGVRHMNVLLHPKMVDMAAPVTIVVNGAIAFNAVPTVDIAQLLDRVREFDDRGRVYYASIPINVTTDVAVPVPTYE